MDKINLTLPINGSTNWGNGINKNFIQLLQEQKKLRDSIAQVQSLISQREGLQLDAEQFVYLKTEDSVVTGYLVDFSEWSSDTKPTITIFDPGNAEDMQAYVVQVDNSGTLFYQGEEWLTNDILYIYKDINNINSVLRWPSSVGGYYEPQRVYFDNSTGQIKIDYERKPACITESNMAPTITTTVGFMPNAKVIIGTKGSSDAEYNWNISGSNDLQLLNMPQQNWLCDIQFYTSNNERFYIGYSINFSTNTITITPSAAATIPSGAKFRAYVVTNSQYVNEDSSESP